MTRNNFNWVPGLFIIGYHLTLLFVLPLYFFHYSPQASTLVAAAFMLFFTGLCVTAGYHRLYSHSTYKINPVVETILLFFSTMATQGSVLRWSFDHRHHHAFMDSDQDPYSIKKGFWYAHFLWLLEKPKPIDNKIIADLVKKPLLRFQHRFYGPLMLISNVIASVFFGWLLNDYLGSFLFVWLVRLFVSHHLTWFINSLAHTWGDRPFSQQLSAVDNYMIALLTWGEGYHNYHHTFSNDYRNGIRWYHYDPTKWLIFSLNKLGLASRLKKNHDHFIEKRVILERKEILLNKIQTSLSDSKKAWEEKVVEITDSILDKLQSFRQAKDEYLKLKLSEAVEKEKLQALIHHAKSLKKGLNEELKACKSLSEEIMTHLKTKTQPSFKTSS